MAGRFRNFLSCNAVIEKPRIYPQVKQRKGDLNDLVDLAMVAGAVAAGVDEPYFVRTLYPHEWKGNMPKEKMTALIRSRLSDSESNLVALEERACGRLIHNVLDAVGIGLYVSGRLTEKVIHYE